MRASNCKRRTPSWTEVAETSRIYGWYPHRVEDDKVVLEMGRQRIFAKRMPGSRMWKVEYFSGSIMDDTTGVESERSAKVDMTEMAVLK